MTTQRRVVAQDATSTHILVAFLAVSLVLYLLSWIICRRTDVLACSPTRIASVAALIAGGNLVAKSSREGEEDSLGDIADEFEHPDSRFWLGWGNLPDEEGLHMGGENEAGVSQFGIFVIGREKLT
ncbi:hypothetical protein F4859DRAFT_526406 [Xylaria cf. heliscus]|nr:hypothetical protein F4859DRAFT_526406 [Xylaria cf. heliscus]